MRYADLKSWASVMGRDLPLADRQPLQSVRLAKDGTLAILRHTLKQMGIGPDDGVALEADTGRLLLRRCPGGARRG